MPDKVKGVSLRPSTPADHRPGWEWGNNSDIAYWVNLPQDAAGSWQPTTYEDYSDDWKAFYFDGSEPRLGRAFIVEVDGEPAGIVAYNDIDTDAQRAEIDIWLRGEQFCGKGYGSAAIALLSAYLRKEFGLAEVWAQPSERNCRSVSAFQKVGFERHARASDPVFMEYGTPDYPDSVLLVYRLTEL